MMKTQIKNCIFFTVKDVIIVTGDLVGNVHLNDVFISLENQSTWQVVSLGRRDLKTPKNRVGIVLSPIDLNSIPTEGSTLVKLYV